MKLFQFEIQILGQIFCEHKPYFLMPGHIYTLPLGMGDIENLAHTITLEEEYPDNHNYCFHSIFTEN